MVAENVEHIGVSERIRSEKLDNAHPILIACRVVDGIARLNSEIEILLVKLRYDLTDVSQILCLNISEDKERDLAVAIVCLEGVFRRPQLSVAYSVYIGRILRKARNRGTVQSDHCIAALREGQACACGFDGAPFSRVGKLILELLSLCVGRGEPGYTVFKSAVCGGVIHHTVGCTVRLSLCRVARKLICKGQSSFFIPRIYLVIAGRRAEAVCYKLAVGVGISDKRSVGKVDTDTLRRRSLACYRDHSVLADQNRRCIHGIHAVYRIFLRRLRAGMLFAACQHV